MHGAAAAGASRDFRFDNDLLPWQMGRERAAVDKAGFLPDM
jgi:hypothetical protein